MNIPSIKSDRTRALLAGLGLAGIAACGVTDHPHAQQMTNTNNDFGPNGGTPAVTVAGSPPVAMAGAPATGGAPGFGGAPMTGGGTSLGGTSAAGAATGGTSTAGAATGGASTGGSAGSPPLSGVTITLGTNVVPMEHAIAFIHIGHSNMAGRATVPTGSRAYHFTDTDPHAWMYHVAANGGGGMPGPPALAIEPKTAGDEDGAGPGTSLVKQAAALAPNYYFISLGYAVPSAYCSQFVPGGLYYDKLIAAPKAIKGKVTFGAIFIYLGITERADEDGHTAADTANFPTCINTLVTAIRNDVGVPNLPLIENNYEVEGTGEFAVGGDVYNAIYPQIQKIPTTVSNSVLIPCDGLGMEDDHHFNLDGQFTWVQRAMATMQTKGWFPWN
jgi:hypothetical protein